MNCIGIALVQLVSFDNPGGLLITGDCCDKVPIFGCGVDKCDPYFVVCIDETSNTEWVVNFYRKGNSLAPYESDDDDDVNVMNSVLHSAYYVGLPVIFHNSWILIFHLAWSFRASVILTSIVWWFSSLLPCFARFILSRMNPVLHSLHYWIAFIPFYSSRHEL